MRAIVISTMVLAVAGCSTRRRSADVAATGVRWERSTEIAQGGGTRGEWRQNDSRYDYVDDGSVAFAPDGGLVVAWVDQAKKDVFVETRAPDGDRVHAAVNVSRTPAVYSWLPRLAIVDSDVYVLWQEIVFSGGTHGGDAYFARSRDGGATFEPAQNLSRSRNGDGKGRITAKVWHNGSLDLAAANEDVIATWTEYDGALWVSRSSDRGATFSPPVQIALDQGPARAPSLALSGDIVYLAWSVGEQAHGDVRIARSLDRGATFEPPHVVTKTAGFSDAPKLATSGDGVLHLAWAEGAGGPFGKFTVMYARSHDRGRSFEPARSLSAAISPHGGSFPMLAVEGQTLVVCWEPGANASERSRGLLMAYSLDGGSSFTEPTLIEESVDSRGGFNGSHQGRLMEKLALQNGRIALANSALAAGRGSRVWVLQGSLPAARAHTRFARSVEP